MSATPPPDSPKVNRPEGASREWFRTWRWFFVLFAVIALVALFYAVEDWRGKRAWERYKQQMQARGERFETADFVPAPVPDDENFAMTPLLAPLFDFVPGTQQWRDTNALAHARNFATRFNAAANLVKGKTAVWSNSWGKAAPDLVQWRAAFINATNRSGRADNEQVSTNVTARQAATDVLASLSDCAPALEELRRALSRPRSRFNLDYQEENPASILLPHLAILKNTAQILQLRAYAELAAGRREDGCSDLQFALALPNTLRDEPILISQLVRIAMVQLVLSPLGEGMGGWSDSQLRAFQERLRQFDFCADMRRALEGERTMLGGAFIEYLRRSLNKLRVLSQVGGAEGTSGDFSLAGAVFAVAPEGWLSLEKLNYSRFFDDYLLPTIDLTNRQIRPTASRRAEDRLLQTARHSPPARLFQHEFFSGMLLPAVTRICQKAAFAQTGVDTAGLACALQRYRQAQGKYPASLNDLLPQFLDKLPHDLITGQPLKYHSTEDGQYVLYSVGWNETDDGGMVARAKVQDHRSESGVGPDLNEGDWVWRPK